MVDRPAPHFDLVGDPDTLPNAFFDALAGLLLAIDERGETRPDAADKSQMAAEGQKRQLARHS